MVISSWGGTPSQGGGVPQPGLDVEGVPLVPPSRPSWGVPQVPAEMGYPWDGVPPSRPSQGYPGYPPLSRPDWGTPWDGEPPSRHGWGVPRNGVPPIQTWLGGTRGWGTPWDGVPPRWYPQGWGTPRLGLDGGHPIPGVPQSYLDGWGYPISGWRGYPSQVLMWGVCQVPPEMGYSPGMGYPHPDLARGVPPLSKPDWGTPLGWGTPPIEMGYPPGWGTPIQT